MRTFTSMPIERILRVKPMCVYGLLLRLCEENVYIKEKLYHTQRSRVLFECVEHVDVEVLECGRTVIEHGQHFVEFLALRLLHIAGRHGHNGVRARPTGSWAGVGRLIGVGPSPHAYGTERERKTAFVRLSFAENT